MDNADVGLLSTVFPAVASSLRLGNADLGLLVALSRLASLPCGPGWVWVSGRVGRRTALTASPVLGGCALALAGSSRGFGSLLVAQILLAGCLVGLMPIAQAVLADSFDDAHRSRAVGYFFGTSTLITAALGPVNAWLTMDQGWRWSMRAAGLACVLLGLVVAVAYREPGVGRADRRPAVDAGGGVAPTEVRTAAALSVFRVPTFAVVMVSRLLSGHFLLTVFGVQFLVTERGFSNLTATVVVVPYGLGYFAGAVAGGWLVAGVDLLLPRHGRIVVLQLAQLTFAAAIFAGTQVSYRSLTPFAVCCLVAGALQALNPVTNRPLVMAVVPPLLRGQAFALFGVVDTVAGIVLTIAAGRLADAFTLQTAFFWVLVVMILLNAAWLSLLHLTYPSDRLDSASLTAATPSAQPHR